MNEVILPANEPGQAISASGFALFENGERRPDADQANIEFGEQDPGFFHFRTQSQDHVIDDQIVAFGRLGGNSCRARAIEPFRCTADAIEDNDVRHFERDGRFLVARKRSVVGTSLAPVH
jgi:hypothetical protein